MTNDREQRIRLIVESDSAVRGVDNFRKSSTELNQSLEVLQKGFSVVKTALQALPSALAEAGRIEGVTRAFETLQAKSGLLASESLPKLQAATKGLIADFNLMQQANQAVQLGLDASKLDIMAAAAVKLGAAVGRDATEAFSDLVTGVGRGSALILDNLGIIVDTNAAYDTFAKKLGTTTSKLTDQQKTLAFQEAAYEAILKSSNALSDANDTAAQTNTKLSATFENLKNEMLSELSANDDVNEALKLLNERLKEVDVSSLIDLFGKLVISSANVADGIYDIADAFKNTLYPTFDQAKSELGQLSQFFTDTQAAISRFGFVGFASSPLSAWEDVASTRRRQEREQKAAKEDADFRKQHMAELLGYLERQEAASRDRRSSADKETIKQTGTFFADTWKAAGDTLDDLITGATGDGSLGSLANSYAKIINDAVEKGIVDSQQQMQESADFFSDALYNAMTGAAFDAEDMMKRVLAGVAGGFLSTLTNGFGAGLGDLQGLGQKIGSSILSGAGLDLSSLGLGGLAGGGATFGPYANGAAYGSLLGGGAFGGTGALPLMSSLPMLAAAGGTAYAGYDVYKSLSSGNKANWWSSAALMPVTGGLSAFAPFIGGGGKDADQQKRDGYRDTLFEMDIITDPNGGKDKASFSMFGGGRGSLATGGNNFNFSGDSRIGGLGNILGNAAGGDSQLGAMFATALQEAESFNAALLTTSDLLGQMGKSAEDAMNDATAAFLNTEGALTGSNEALGAFNVQMDLLTQLAANDLPSVEAGFDLLADAIDGKPKDALKALELTFGELKQAGLQDSGAVKNFLTEKFGPDVASVFENLSAHGIDQFTDFKNLSAGEIQQLFNLIQPVANDIQNAIRNALVGPANDGADAVSQIARAFRDVKDEADAAKDSIDNANRAAKQAPTGKSKGAGEGTTDSNG